MRYATVPAKELQTTLGLLDHHLDPAAPWLTVVDWESVTDAKGQPVHGCVFADTETGLVVLRERTPGLHPFRCANRPAPLAVKLKE